MSKNTFINSGRHGARKAIEQSAKREIVSIEASHLAEDEKRGKIAEIEAKRDLELEKLSDAWILWGKH